MAAQTTATQHVVGQGQHCLRRLLDWDILDVVQILGGTELAADLVDFVFQREMQGVLRRLDDLLMAFSTGLLHEMGMGRLGKQIAMRGFLICGSAVAPMAYLTGELVRLIQMYRRMTAHTAGFSGSTLPPGSSQAFSERVPPTNRFWGKRQKDKE